MRNAAEKGKCTRCNHKDATRANECDHCHRVTVCMAVVHSIWGFNELENLAETLSQGSLKQVFDVAKDQGAYLRLRLLHTIRSQAHPAIIHPDDLKRKVIFAITDHVREINSYTAWEEKTKQPGKWMEQCRSVFAEMEKSLATGKP